jgi:hypothetical protein
MTEISTPDSERLTSRVYTKALEREQLTEKLPTYWLPSIATPGPN